MLVKRESQARGHNRFDWLNSRHSFSFGGYHDPKHMGFGPLRVINQDVVAPGKGFATHPHANMEIISYVLSGALAHKDSMGNGSTIEPSQIQLMSAGSGISHSEFNANPDREVEFLQIWVIPNVRDEQPDYQEMTLNSADMQGRFAPLITPDGADGTLRIKQDATMLAGTFDAGQTSHTPLDPDRRYWVQIVTGEGTLNDAEYAAGDGFALDLEAVLVLNAKTDSHILLFDLPEGAFEA